LDQEETLQRIVTAIADLPGIAAITMTFCACPPMMARWLIFWMN